jgi:hypothetical protein
MGRFGKRGDAPRVVGFDFAALDARAAEAPSPRAEPLPAPVAAPVTVDVPAPVAAPALVAPAPVAAYAPAGSGYDPPVATLAPPAPAYVAAPVVETPGAYVPAGWGDPLPLPAAPTGRKRRRGSHQRSALGVALQVVLVVAVLGGTVAGLYHLAASSLTAHPAAKPTAAAPHHTGLQLTTPPRIGGVRRLATPAAIAKENEVRTDLRTTRGTVVGIYGTTEPLYALGAIPFAGWTVSQAFDDVMAGSRAWAGFTVGARHAYGHGTVLCATLSVTGRPGGAVCVWATARSSGFIGSVASTRVATLATETVRAVRFVENA